MKIIPLSQGKVALVDDEDFEYLNQWKWYAHKSGNRWYAVRNGYRGSSKRVFIRMHRIIMNPCLTMEVDHIDHNGLNNQRRNLRIVTRYQNGQNSRSGMGRGLSKYKGVSWYVKTNKWRVRTFVKGRYFHIGYFVSEVEAAKAYDVAALKYFGEYACTNEMLYGTL